MEHLSLFWASGKWDLLENKISSVQHTKPSPCQLNTRILHVSAHPCFPKARPRDFKQAQQTSIQNSAGGGKYQAPPRSKRNAVPGGAPPVPPAREPPAARRRGPLLVGFPHGGHPEGLSLSCPPPVCWYAQLLGFVLQPAQSHSFSLQISVLDWSLIDFRGAQHAECAHMLPFPSRWRPEPGALPLWYLFWDKARNTLFGFLNVYCFCWIFFEVVLWLGLVGFVALVTVWREKCWVGLCFMGGLRWQRSGRLITIWSRMMIGLFWTDFL